jgi:hypothetical protein
MPLDESDLLGYSTGSIASWAVNCSRAVALAAVAPECLCYFACSFTSGTLDGFFGHFGGQN